ncbi:type 1 glutamine amidotransferase domain-containing protein [Cellulomonas sp. URHD0024]|uniref:type 1 glutamine amidotransferase domain-containing protein n=1 Tax=Cellulomonas sp. URHD0024 TaxID=1302620 RepID=UPI00041EBC63|nr:type 1 glutamine amidotransferase domain-containing protein [Cellulomonas sp. URHD0024]
MTDTDLTGHTVLVLVTTYGVEQDELVVPVDRLRADGATVVVAADSAEPVQTLVSDQDPGQRVTPDATFGDVQADDFDALLLPGGTINADNLRLQAQAVELVRSFAGAGKPIAAICHGPWALIEAGVVRDRSLTSYASLQTDLRNAGASWTDEPVVTDHTGGFPLVTSRNPGDLDDFVPAVAKAVVARATARA